MSAAPKIARRTLTVGRAVMLLAALAMIAAALVAYPYADRFSLGLQIAAHVALPVAAALFKLGYVVRLASHHALGNFAAG